MKNLYKMTFAALALAVAGCSSDSDGGSATGNCDTNIAFFQAGKFQKYNVFQFGSDMGTMKLTYGDCDGNGFVSNMEFRDPANNITQNVPNRFWQDGVFLMNDAGNDDIDFKKIYKKDAALNDTWSQTDLDGAITTHTVVDIDSLITVPAGEFHCKVYHWVKTDVFNDSYIFWNDEVGQIMEDAGFFQTELVDHN
jgi:hypothetical protein